MLNGTLDDSLLLLKLRHSTMWIKYVTGGLTVAYQEHEVNDGHTAATTDESDIIRCILRSK